MFEGLFIEGELAATVRFADECWHARAGGVHLRLDTQAAAVSWCELRAGYRRPTPAELEADAALDDALTRDGWRRWADPSAGQPFDYEWVWWLSVDFKRPTRAYVHWLGDIMEQREHEPWYWKPIDERSATHLAAGADGIRAGQVWGDDWGVNWRVRSVDHEGPDAVAVLEPTNLTEPAADERVRAGAVAEGYTLLSDAWAALAATAEI